jgi:polysaccharide biosynthesis protein PslH
MRILFLANKVPWPLKDGGAIGTFSLAFGLAMLDCEVDLFAINTEKHYIDINEIPLEIRDKLNIETQRLNTDIQTGKLLKNFIFSNKPYIAERFFHPDFTKRLITKLTTTQYDVVILEMLYLSMYIPTIRKYSKAHITLRTPNIEYEIWAKIAGNTQNSIKKLYLKNMAKRLRTLEHKVMNSYDSLIPVSETNAETYQKMGVKVPIIVTTTGVFLDKIPEKHNTAEENALAHIGALDWIPNIEGLQWFVDKVWPIIHKNNPDIHFYIAGRNAPVDIHKFFNKPNIHFLGEIPDSYTFILSKSILIVPLLSGSGMRVKIIEGLALGRSIVSTSIGAEGINVISGKHLEIQDNPLEFANACMQLYENKQKRQNLSLNGKSFIEANYDNLKIAEKLKNFYQSTLG